MRRAERTQITGHWMRLRRMKGEQGLQIVNMNDLSSFGASFLDLTGAPYKVEDLIEITDGSFALPELPCLARVRHVTRMNDDQGEYFVVGFEFIFRKNT